LTGFKARVHSLAKTSISMASDNPAIAREAHELLGEANDVIMRGQRQIRKLLRRLGMIQEGLEVSSIKTPALVLDGTQPGLTAGREN
jgi:hypothetical protein